MAEHPPLPSFGVVTPTFRRPVLLRRFLDRLVRQSYPRWRSVIVHDGPDAETAALVARYTGRDPRIGYLQLDARTNDTGVSPRHAGASHFSRMDDPPDYCVFWDDDNYFATDALGRVAEALVAADRPDLLMVGMEYRSRVLPPERRPVDALCPGHVDTANLVLRPQLAVEAYADLLRRKAESPEMNLYTSDFMAFDFVRRLCPAPRIRLARDAVVGFHDGLRWMPYLRHLLGIPPLDLAGRPWFRFLTLGMLKWR